MGGNNQGAGNHKGGKKGSWGAGSRNAEDAAKAAAAASDDDQGAGEEGEKEARLPKRKVALLIGYSGTGYQGLQANHNVKTIEGDLFKALVQAGAISKDNADDIKKVSLMRSARTDKGVHAAGNVVSLKMILDVPDVPDIVSKVNSLLPAQIRLFGYIRTINSFNPKVLCDSRVYEYLLPTYVFLPRPPLPAKSAAESEIPSTTEPAKSSIRTDAPEGSLAWDQNVHISTPEEMAVKRSYRIDPETWAKVRDGFAEYVGTKNFHNYTIGKDFKDHSCKRYIMKFDVSEPKMIQGTEWLSLKVHGQSFMLHQIRKMVGLIVMIIRTDTPLKLISETFKSNKINIPKAPSLGLLLERPLFDTYNRKFQGKHQPIVFDPFKEEMEAFKEKYIYEGIIKEELEFNRFDEYLQIMDGHADRYNFAYLNKEGIIPEEAIIKRGDTFEDIE
ncbi:pseudouridine synthase [Lobosporangium transversale]|uniref:Pseudouridine synthase n=1 Tax=Lobosporangium transversale TaxID=64571 RepID=A0A1Y2G763_9FUNG|nr:pseudouridine synthase [Lobosporangium transversale]ORY99674.1 pseudouridine synthase [Lobosporangium transversale]|eukprot:XP_021875938.1 pseudouridine synthase [Lobosporangium transversale]